jgi:hypothetical protein
MGDNDKVGIAVLFCNDKTSIDLETVNKWFEGKFTEVY